MLYVFQELHEESCMKIADLEKELDKASYETRAKDEMMDDMKESLRYLLYLLELMLLSILVKLSKCTRLSIQHSG